MSKQKVVSIRKPSDIVDWAPCGDGGQRENPRSNANQRLTAKRFGSAKEGFYGYHLFSGRKMPEHNELFPVRKSLTKLCSGTDGEKMACLMDVLNFVDPTTLELILSDVQSRGPRLADMALTVRDSDSGLELVSGSRRLTAYSIAYAINTLSAEQRSDVATEVVNKWNNEKTSDQLTKLGLDIEEFVSADGIWAYPVNVTDLDGEDLVATASDINQRSLEVDRVDVASRCYRIFSRARQDGKTKTESLARVATMVMGVSSAQAGVYVKFYQLSATQPGIREQVRTKDLGWYEALAILGCNPASSKVVAKMSNAQQRDISKMKDIDGVLEYFGQANEGQKRADKQLKGLPKAVKENWDAVRAFLRWNLSQEEIDAGSELAAFDAEK